MHGHLQVDERTEDGDWLNLLLYWWWRVLLLPYRTSSSSSLSIVVSLSDNWVLIVEVDAVISSCAFFSFLLPRHESCDNFLGQYFLMWFQCYSRVGFHIFLILNNNSSVGRSQLKMFYLIYPPSPEPFTGYNERQLLGIARFLVLLPNNAIILSNAFFSFLNHEDISCTISLGQNKYNSFAYWPIDFPLLLNMIQHAPQNLLGC